MAYDYVIWGVAAFVIVLGLLAILLMRRGRWRDLEKPDQLQTLGITLVVLGIVFGDDPLLGYSFIGVGVFLSIASLVLRRRRTRA